ncbi:hypothetical protein D3C76_898480 [compost metagenome]
MPGAAAGHQQQAGAPGRCQQLRQLLGGRCAVGLEQFDAAHGPGAGQAAQVRRELAGLPALEAADQCGFLAFAPGRKVGVAHFIQGRQGCRTRHRVAGVGAAKAAFGQVVDQRLAADHCAQRHAAGDALGQQQQVRLDAQAREGEALAGAAKPRLDLIDDNQDAVLVTEAAQGFGEVWFHCQEAGFTLHRFEDECSHIVDVDLDAEQPRQGLKRLLAADAGVPAGVGQVIHRPRQHADPLLVGRNLAVKVEGRQGAAMEAAVEGDDRGLAGGTAGDLQGVFCRFRTAVGEHAAERVGHRYELRQAVHQFEVGFMPGGVESVVSQTRGLLLDGGDNPRVTMAQVQHANAANEINITFTVGVPDFRIFTVGQCNRVNYGNRLADSFVTHLPVPSLQFLII